MRGALWFYMRRAAITRGRRWLRRLRRPQYSGLVALGVAWLAASRAGVFADAEAQLADPHPALAGGVALGGAWGLGLMLAARWVLGLRGVDRGVPRASAPLWLSAPISTGQLLWVRWAGAQARLVASSLVILLYGLLAELPLWGAPLALTAWLVGTTLALHESVVLLTFARALPPAVATMLRVLMALALPALLLGAISPLPPVSLSAEAWMTWLASARPEGWAGAALAPIFAMARLPMVTDASSLGATAAVALALPGVMLALALLLRGVHLGELVLGGHARGHRRAAGVPSWALRVRLPLAQQGARWRALVWMILTPVVRRDLPILLSLFAALIAGAVVGTLGEGSGLALLRRLMTFSLVAAVMVVPWMGPGLLRADLRVTLARVDLIRALPVTGAELVRASIYAPALVMVLVEVALMLALTALAALGVVSPRAAARLPEMWALLPGPIGVTVMAFTAQNAVVLLFPRWFITPGASGGIGAARMEADGGTLLAGLAYGLVMGLLLLPPALLAGGLALAAAVFDWSGGLSGAPLWGFCLGALVLSEATLRLLGRHLDKDYDPSLIG